jgi:S1-C subfamily serine protease
MTDMEQYPFEPRTAQPPLPPPPGVLPSEPFGALPSAPPSAPPRRARAAIAASLVGLLLIITGVGIGLRLTRRDASTSAATRVPVLVPSSAGQSGGGGSLNAQAKAIAARVLPAVVDINTFQRTSYVAGSPTGETPLGAGTGMILTSSGEVLTNNHVVVRATSIRVAVPGHGTHEATVVGADPTDDVALIQVQGVSGLPTVNIGNASALQLGQELVAIGNALGRGGTPSTTAGSVTGLDRTITANDETGGSERLQGMIQTDAQISPGDSGGALVTSAGQVVGMITAGSRTGVATTTSRVGFAITTDTALKIVNEIRSGQGSSSVLIGPRGFLGVYLNQAVPGALNPGLPSGAVVGGALPGTPAAKAGIGPDAVITSIDGQTISSAVSLGTVLHQHAPGDVVQVTWVDAAGTHTSSVSLIQGPAV